MDKIGITGASGTLGRILIKKFKALGIDYSCFNGDICSRTDIKNWISNNNLESLIHFAAMVPIKEVNENPKKAYEINVIGTENLLKEIKLMNKNPWLFYASTSHVYKSKNRPIRENDEIVPISEYGKTKYEAEKILTKEYQNLCIGRIFSFYHDTQKKPFLYPNIKYRL